MAVTLLLALLATPFACLLILAFFVSPPLSYSPPPKFKAGGGGITPHFCQSRAAAAGRRVRRVEGDFFYHLPCFLKSFLCLFPAPVLICSHAYTLTQCVKFCGF